METKTFKNLNILGPDDDDKDKYEKEIEEKRKKIEDAVGHNIAHEVDDEAVEMIDELFNQ
jgi:hypothetical protein